MIKASLVLGLAACASAINVGDKIPSVSLDYGARWTTISTTAPQPHCGGILSLTCGGTRVVVCGRLPS